MNVEEMIKLIDAGFTAAEIKEMNKPKEPEPEKKPKDPEPAETPKPEAPKDDIYQGLLKEIKDLKKAVYAVNVMNTQQPDQKNADEILMKMMEGGR